MNDIEKIFENSEDLAKEVYCDVIKPTAKPVGTVLSLLPRTIRVCLGRWEKWIINGEESLELTAQALKEKIELIPEEKQCEPEPYVAIPAIQQIAYCYDSEELRELYANLLASSMNIDKKWDVHPSFVDIIKQLTPDEARLLSKLLTTTNDNIPIINIKSSIKGSEGFYYVAKSLMPDEFYSICDAPNQMNSYLDNLERLKLIHRPRGLHFVNDNIYKEIENSNRTQSIIGNVEMQGDKATIEKVIICITDFGISFKKTCIL